MSDEWSKTSWRSRPAKHQPVYQDKKELMSAKNTLSHLPALVSFEEVDALRSKLRSVYEGRSFYLQGGHCAETFDQCQKKKIQPMLDVMNIMTKVISDYTDLPVVTLGRMAGQYAKPRSSPTEVVDGVTMESYKGDIMNSRDALVNARIPDPNRMVQGYFRSAACLNFIRSSTYVSKRASGEMMQQVRQILGTGMIRSCFHPGMLGFGEDDYKFNKLSNMLIQKDNAVKNNMNLGENFFISHEGLLMEYEESMTREEPADASEANGIHYNASTHMLWIGHRTRGLEDAHVEYFRGLHNPVGVKVGPGTTPELLVKLIKTLDPKNQPGKIILISRFGAEKVLKALPPLVEAVRDAGLKVIWVCDPMHGNTFKANGFKTRDFTDITKEILETISVHQSAGTRLNGLHLEMCGEDVTECIGGPEKLVPSDLSRCFLSACDPRLNFQQSVALSFAVGAAMAHSTQASEKKSKTLASPKLTVNKDNSLLTKHQKTLVQYGKIHGLNKPVSKLIYGTLFLHKVADPFALLDSIWNSGCNAFDTAAIYGSPEGRCEEVLGSWIKSRNIDLNQLVVITKGGCSGADAKWAPRMGKSQIVQDLDGSLSRLGLDCVDMYLLHRDDPSIPVEDIVDTMHSLVLKGKILTWGVSNWSIDRLKAAIAYAKKNCYSAPVVDSTQASLATPKGPVWPGTTYMSNDRETFYAENRTEMSVLAWEALAKGFMTGKWNEEDLAIADSLPYRERTLVKAYCTTTNFKRRTRAELLAKSKGVALHNIALAYLLKCKCEMFVLVGTSKFKHFDSNLGMFNVSLTQKEFDWLRNGGELHDHAA